MFKKSSPLRDLQYFWVIKISHILESLNGCYSAVLLLFLIFFFFFWGRVHYVAKAGLELAMLHKLSPCSQNMWSPCISLPSAAITSVRHTPDFTLFSANFVTLLNWRGVVTSVEIDTATENPSRRRIHTLSNPKGHWTSAPWTHLASSWRKPETTFFYPFKKNLWQIQLAKQSLKCLLSVTSSFLEVTTSIIRTVYFAQNTKILQ